MCAAINFDATQYDPNVSREPLPSGQYLCIIESTEVKQTKNGDGYYIEIMRSVVDGVHKGRKVWQRINWVNPNQQAQEIGKREFSNVCHAIGKLQVADTAELHGIPHVAKVKFVPAKGEYAAKNEIDSCSRWDGNPLPDPAGPVPAATPWAQPAAAPAQAATPWGGAAPAPAAAANSSTPPWMQAKR